MKRLSEKQRAKALSAAAKALVCEVCAMRWPEVDLSAQQVSDTLALFFDDEDVTFLEDFLCHWDDPEWGMCEDCSRADFVAQMIARDEAAVPFEVWRRKLQLHHNVPPSLIAALGALEEPHPKSLWYYVAERIGDLQGVYRQTLGGISLPERAMVQCIALAFSWLDWLEKPDNFRKHVRGDALSLKRDAQGKAFADRFEAECRRVDPKLFR